MKNNCPYLIIYKKYKSLDSYGIIYKCTLANALFLFKDLKEKWACGGCIVPQIISNKPCTYLKAHKDFIIRGSSHTWFSCELFNIIMESPMELCNPNCEGYKNNIV